MLQYVALACCDRLIIGIRHCKWAEKEAFGELIQFFDQKIKYAAIYINIFLNHHKNESVNSCAIFRGKNLRDALVLIISCSPYVQRFDY